MSRLHSLLHLPPPLLQPFCNIALEAVRRAHPGMFSRMGRHEGAWFEIRPQDAPVAFYLHASGFSARLVVQPVAKAPPFPPAATMTAPLAILMALLSGSADGDALFFGRDLHITGNMEAVLALRNALDAATINLHEDLTGLLGPLSILLPGTCP
ncbi:MAG TPA: hypothetical protein DCW68_07595 [Rhodospirillaceae bacterium]|nr:MAG: hypothetical protein A2018_08185 [Alphaproteobacteria bacterium GWF2_58_20]HAU29950.1 hypothetical protein [Rhodospirillaceae bacterium]